MTVKQELPAVDTATSKTVPTEDFEVFITRYREKIRDLFSVRHDVNEFSQERGLPEGFMSSIQTTRPLSAVIPHEYGGRGGKVSEFLSVLEASSYESLPLSLTLGINGALFLQPVTRYAGHCVKESVFAQVLTEGALGGLMITEPKYGSDALGMETSFEETPNGYHLRGTKHWGGLTGQARYWLLTARRRTASGELQRDIDFFVCDTEQAGQRIVVEEYYPSLGLYMIPYGRNTIDVVVPAENRLAPTSTGIKMLLDTLHRSRVQFPGMAMGFLRRIVDEGVRHCRERVVGKKSLASYDQVDKRLATLQAYYTSCSAMCAYASENAGVDKDLSGLGVAANSVKALVTDYMHQAADSLLQLMGAKGYRLDRFAGRATIDSRPFQIFEGSNDILYQQISESIVRAMKKLKQRNLLLYLTELDVTRRGAQHLKGLLSFEIDWSMPQRKLVDLGRMLARIVSMDFILELGDRGFRSDLIANSLANVRCEVEAIVTRVRSTTLVHQCDDYREGSAWKDFVVTSS